VSVEVWELQHPRRGLIRVEQGFDAEFCELYPDWPEQPTRTASGLASMTA